MNHDLLDNFEHYFCECELVKDFWDQLFNLWHAILGIRLAITNVDILFGMCNINMTSILAVSSTAEFYFFEPNE